MPWSYSVLDSFETCPRRHYLIKISKQVVEPQTEALMWGNKVHKALEHRLVNSVPLPTEMAAYEPFAASVVAKGVGGQLRAEQKLALTSSYTPTTFFAKDVWVRGITDFDIEKGTRLFIGDWKTGKVNPNSAQMKLMAGFGFATKPWITEITTSFIWLNAGEVTTEKFVREDAPQIWQGFLPRVARLDAAIAKQDFPPKPSGLCKKWCPVPLSMCEHRG